MSLVEKPKTPINFSTQIPKEILENPLLNQAISLLPTHYNFEIHKSIWRILELKKQLNKPSLLIGLQFPEGLMMFACLINDIIVRFTDSECVILGDVTYGACCVDDLTIRELGGDFLIHYGHSCLVPINETEVKTLYVFVEIRIDMDHFVKTFVMNFQVKNQQIFILGTIQFNSVVFEAKSLLEKEGFTNLIIPQEKPRSAGEVLGCTSPILPDHKGIVVFLCDGRFHMEAVMIRNPAATFYQYNPYSKILSIEEYDNEKMMKNRENAIKISKNSGKRVCVIFGVLGRQGNKHILERLEENMKNKGLEYTILMNSEVNVQQLQLLNEYLIYFSYCVLKKFSFFKVLYKNFIIL